jgi:hypothetical protein
MFILSPSNFLLPPSISRWLSLKGLDDEDGQGQSNEEKVMSSMGVAFSLRQNLSHGKVRTTLTSDGDMGPHRQEVM